MPTRHEMGKRSVAKAVGVAFEPGPMGPAVDALVDRALTLAFGQREPAPIECLVAAISRRSARSARSARSGHWNWNWA